VTISALDSDLLDAVEAGDKKAVKALVAAGADVNATRHGRTALWLAAHNGRRRIVERLIAAGADVDRANGGLSPLLAALEAEHFSLAHTLATPTHCPDALGSDGETALWLCAAHGFLELAAAALILRGADVNHRADGVSVLARAVQHHNHSGCALLLAAGADVVLNPFCDIYGLGVVSLVALAASSDRRPCLALLLAAGAQWFEDDAEQIGEDEIASISLDEARQELVRVGWEAIRERVFEICVALQDLRIPALQLVEIVLHACAPFAERLPFHMLWNTVVAIKHFQSP
jgi:hypothetical protein